MRVAIYFNQAFCESLKSIKWSNIRDALANVMKEEFLFDTRDQVASQKDIVRSFIFEEGDSEIDYFIERLDGLSTGFESYNKVIPEWLEYFNSYGSFDRVVTKERLDIKDIGEGYDLTICLFNAQNSTSVGLLSVVNSEQIRKMTGCICLSEDELLSQPNRIGPTDIYKEESALIRRMEGISRCLYHYQTYALFNMCVKYVDYSAHLSNGKILKGKRAIYSKEKLRKSIDFLYNMFFANCDKNVPIHLNIGSIEKTRFYNKHYDIKGLIEGFNFLSIEDCLQIHELNLRERSEILKLQVKSYTESILAEFKNKFEKEDHRNFKIKIIYTLTGFHVVKRYNGPWEYDNLDYFLKDFHDAEFSRVLNGSRYLLQYDKNPFNLSSESSSKPKPIMWPSHVISNLAKSIAVDNIFDKEIRKRNLVNFCVATYSND